MRTPTRNNTHKSSPKPTKKRPAPSEKRQPPPPSKKRKKISCEAPRTPQKTNQDAQQKMNGDDENMSFDDSDLQLVYLEILHRKIQSVCEKSALACF